MAAHILTLRDRSAYSHGRFNCDLCFELGCGPCYHCEECQFDIHAHCAATARIQTHFCHSQHPLCLFDLTGRNKICDGCGDRIYTWAFTCTECDFSMHSLCVKAPRFVVHPAHTHVLALFNAMARKYDCAACLLPAKNHIYACSSCGYYLHQSCVRQSFVRKHHQRHAEHELELVLGPSNFETRRFFCNGCGLDGRGWRFSCSQCSFNLHMACAKVSHELPHRAYDHDPPLPRDPLPHQAHDPPLPRDPLPHRAHDPPLPRDPLPRRAHDPPLPRDPSTTASTVRIEDLEALERIVEFTRNLLRNPVGDDPREDSENEGENICPTCHEGFNSENPIKTTSCGHEFHFHCIRLWMERSEQCPICRQRITHLI